MRRWIAGGVLIGLALTAPLAACGPPKKDSVVGPLPSASASPATISGVPPASGLPPFAVVPPPGVVGSRKAKRKEIAGLDACVPAAITGKDVGAELPRLAQICAKTGPSKPVAQAFRGAQGDGEPAAHHKVHVDAGRCYRVYVAHDARSAVVGLRDSAGDLVTESPTLAAPESGVACFAAADDLEITVSIGSGKTSYAVQLFGD